MVWKMISYRLGLWRPLQKAKKGKGRREMASLMCHVEYWNAFGEEHEIPFKPLDFYPLSFLPEWDSQSYMILESFLGNTVMVKLKLYLLLFSLFSYLLGAFRGGGHSSFFTISHFLRSWGRYTKKHILAMRRLGESKGDIMYLNMSWMQASHQAHAYNSLSKCGFRI